MAHKCHNIPGKYLGIGSKLGTLDQRKDNRLLLPNWASRCRQQQVLLGGRKKKLVKGKKNKHRQ